MISLNQSLRAALFALLPGLLLSLPLQAQQPSVIHCEGACPSYGSELAANRARLVIHHLYAAGMNNDTGLADWVAYRLSADSVGLASLLPRDWQSDRLLRFAPLQEELVLEQAEVVLPSLTGGNEYGAMSEPGPAPAQRARLVPLTSFANTPYWAELNQLSNQVPMPNPLRLGPWFRLEQRLNDLAREQGELYVLSGPLHLATPAGSMPSDPIAYYKVVRSERGIVAFVFPADTAQYDDYCASMGEVSQIERMADLTLFPDRDVVVSDALARALGCS